MLQHVEARAIAGVPGVDWDLAESLAHRLNRDLGMRVVLREAIAARAEEPVTQDLYIEIARAIEQQRWMLLAHSTGPQAAGDG